MAQTATILSQDETLFIQTNNSSDILSHRSFPDRSNSGKDHFVVQNGQLRYNDRIRLNFSIVPQYHTFFGLLKGLIDFHRSPSFSFAYNKSEHTVEVDVAAIDHSSLDSFLNTVFIYLKKEIEFKARLKTIIQFERDYREKMDLVYNSIINVR